MILINNEQKTVIQDRKLSERTIITEDKDKIIKDEISYKGELNYEVISSLLDAAGGKFIVFMLAILVVFTQTALCAGDWFLSYWSRLNSIEQTDKFYLGIYSMIICLCVVCSIIRADIFI